MFKPKVIYLFFQQHFCLNKDTITICLFHILKRKLRAYNYKTFVENHSLPFKKLKI